MVNMGMRGYQKRLFQAAADKKLWLRSLGDVEGWPIWFVKPREGFKSNNPKLLIAAGFHGEEKAGPLALLKWLETFDINLYKKVDLSFLPVVNPVGFNVGQRYNNQKEKSNCGFCHPESGEMPSQEGVILLRNFALLKSHSRDGFLSLHEDVTTDKYYIYTFEHTKEPTKFTYDLRDELGKCFGPPLDNESVVSDAALTTEMKHRTGNAIVHDGIVFQHCDGSLEDALFHEGSRSVVTETPGTYKLAYRIEANIALINKFIDLNRRE